MGREASELVRIAQSLMTTDPAELRRVVHRLPMMGVGDIAEVIAGDWKSVDHAARPWLRTMFSMWDAREAVGRARGEDIISNFLRASRFWRGEVADAVKAELARRIR